MKLYSTDFISGKEIETLQMVRGSVVFSKNVVRDVFAGLKTLVGGEIAGYTEMLNDARNIAIERMTNEATAIGADAIDAANEPKVALLAEKGVDNERLAALFHRAQTLRDEGKTVTVQTMKKNIRRQIELLEAEGYTEIEKVYKN